MRWSWCVFLLLACAPLASGTPVVDDPLPPGNLDGGMDPDTSEITLTWEPPENTGSSPVAYYHVKGFQDGLPMDTEEVPAQTHSLTLQGDADSTYVFTVTAINDDGRESLPSNPLIVNDYPRCMVFTYTLSPPGVNLRPFCLIP